MSFVESLGAASQARSATSTALSERLAQPQSHAIAPVAKNELQTAVRQATAATSTRVMLENPPKEAAPPRKSIPTGTSTAAYLIEMHLAQELADLQEELKE
ncbi:MAG: hypothetical protein KIH71_003845 [Roseobacter sp.]|nr:hypothetical protein [Roseobacter sp.]